MITRLKNHKTPASQSGFTIVELMVATAVLSAVLLIITIAMIGIGRLYYKGINQVQIQNDVRSISNEISQHLRLSADSGTLTDGGTDDTIPRSYCMGSTRYTYLLKKQLGTQTAHVLWRDDVAPGSCATMSDAQFQTARPTPSGTELVMPRARLTQFAINNLSTGTYLINVRAAYGDDDLLENNGQNPDSACLGDVGGQFCATAELNTTISRRL